MTACSRWDVVLVPFPFTDLTSMKRRPALVVSPEAYNRGGPDVVIAFLTSQVHVAPRIGDYRLRFWQECGLPKPTMLRMKFATVAQAMVLKKIGSLPEPEREEIRHALTRFFGDE
jgi:mRNA interferase MazF